jgi:hypothetical protein
MDLKANRLDMFKEYQDSVLLGPYKELESVQTYFVESLIYSSRSHLGLSKVRELVQGITIRLSQYPQDAGNTCIASPLRTSHKSMNGFAVCHTVPWT